MFLTDFRMKLIWVIFLFIHWLPLKLKKKNFCKFQGRKIKKICLNLALISDKMIKYLNLLKFLTDLDN